MRWRSGRDLSNCLKNVRMLLYSGSENGCEEEESERACPLTKYINLSQIGQEIHFSSHRIILGKYSKPVDYVLCVSFLPPLECELNAIVQITLGNYKVNSLELHRLRISRTNSMFSSTSTEVSLAIN
ncbi:hypothetical protein EGR_09822 [Echinococcus granulosus]|uniref:Uncharacterized protein n=1 Tax=Echinococcus granulosus TaxID=6210 RepID=W6UA24_ECHGR|nr:hypothetical protein EGR_09822 [Echinococcus granulosus]EUB55327.1 hypothetical protein EGR_09822 [Echinococcus granulosus]